MNKLIIGDTIIGEDRPVFIISEIGINHNGDIDLAKKLIDMAVIAGCDAVKFQKRNPVEAVPDSYKEVMRETPWGVMSYLDYRKRVEFSKEEYDEIDRYCKEKGILWTASPWDITSIEFLEQYDVPFYKVPSALITDKDYLSHIRQTGKPLFVSTGMADIKLVNDVMNILEGSDIALLHAVSTYPARPEDVHLNVLLTYQEMFDCPIGYSGHEVGLQITLGAVALGAKIIERHITLDRSMWGTDQSASLEPGGLLRLVRDIRIIESAMGTGEKRFQASEVEVAKKLRKIQALEC